VACLDIKMPNLSGMDLLKAFKQSRPDVEVIMMTAFATVETAVEAVKGGAYDYLTKPFEEMELLNAVEARLRKSDVFRKEFTKNIEGLSEFLAQARGLEELSRLSADRKVHHFKKKEMIYMEGDEPNGILFVVKGRIKTYKTNEDGKEFITGIHKEGDFLGYIDLIENTEYRESAEAMDEAEVTIIPRQDFFSLLYSNRDVAAKFIKLLSNNLQETEDRLLNLAYNSVRKRVADALITLQQRYHTAKDQNSGFSVSREDLASMVGTATESVIRTLSDFKEEKLIDIKEKNIFILNPDRLSRMKN